MGQLRGPDILKLCIWVSVRRFPSCPSVWAAIYPSKFSWYGLLRKVAWNHLARICPGGGGALAPVWSYGEALTQVGSHPWMLTQAPLRSWLGTAVPSLRPLVSSRTPKLCRLGKFPLFSPFRYSKHLRMGSVRTPHHLLANQMELWGFIKPSSQTYTVHIVTPQTNQQVWRRYHATRQ
jgi:hypothetical protein